MLLMALRAENNLRLANNKAEDLSIKKLTKNAPSVREMFEQIQKPGEAETGKGMPEPGE